MRKIDLRTRTARFFLDKYGKATIQAAVEAAVAKERIDLLPSMADYAQIPVDLEQIAKQKNITLSMNKERTSIGEAELLAKEDGLHLRTYAIDSKLRRRLSIAHEIGHSLFLQGQRHEIGILSRKEIETEEIICFMFASALIMPLKVIKGVLSDISKKENPWEILALLENAARRMQVSLPALIVRINGLTPHAHHHPPLIILCLRHFANPKTGALPCLRVDFCSSLGSLKDTRTWHNKRVTGINLHSANDLFSMWRQRLGASGEPTGGRYTLQDGNIVRAMNKTLQWVQTSVLFDVREEDKWKKMEVLMQCASCLYAAKGWHENLSYIICLLKPPVGQMMLT
jgi:hypothetical protein